MASKTDHASEQRGIKENNLKYLGVTIQVKRLYSGYHMHKLNPSFSLAIYTKKIKHTKVSFDS